MPAIRPPSFAREAKEAAAAVLHIPAPQIYIELHEHGAERVVLVTWRTSMTDKDKWDAVRFAVLSVLPTQYKHYVISMA
jgi:hypothetical protein